MFELTWHFDPLFSFNSAAEKKEYDKLMLDIYPLQIALRKIMRIIGHRVEVAMEKARSGLVEQI